MCCFCILILNKLAVALLAQAAHVSGGPLALYHDVHTQTENLSVIIVGYMTSTIKPLKQTVLEWLPADGASVTCDIFCNHNLHVDVEFYVFIYLKVLNKYCKLVEPVERRMEIGAKCSCYETVIEVVIHHLMHCCHHH